MEVRIPPIGMAMEETKIVAWQKQEGDRVEAGDVLCEIETEKVNTVIEAPAAGVLSHIVVPAGTTVPVGQVVAVIAEES